MADLEALKIDRSGVTRRAARGGNPWLKALWVAIPLAVLLLFRGPLSRALDKATLPEVRTTRVELSHPAEVGAIQGVSANGYVVAARRAALSADTPGRIVSMHVEEGTAVRQGDVVARLFAEEYAAALELAEGNLAAAKAGVGRAEAELHAVEADLEALRMGVQSARARLQAAQADLKLATLEMKRIEELQAENVASSRELDAARASIERAEASLGDFRSQEQAAKAQLVAGEARVEVSRTALTQAQAQVEVSRAARDQARATLSKTEVRAPFDGVVVLKDAEVGEVVSPNSAGGSTARGSVVTMVDFGSLEVQVDLPEASLNAARPGAPAQVFLDAYPSSPYAGTVSRIWPTANRQKATVEVRIRFDAPDDRLRPDMGVRVVFLPEGAEAPSAGAEAQDATPTVLVDEASVVRRGGKDGVFLVEGDTVTFKVVELGARKAGQLVISFGLQGGESIVALPPATLSDGDRVQLATE